MGGFLFGNDLKYNLRAFVGFGEVYMHICTLRGFLT